MADDDVVDRMEYHKVQLEQAMRRDRDKRGAHIVDAQKFDRALIDFMQHVHGRLPASAAHAAIAAFMRGIFEGYGLISYGDPS